MRATVSVGANLGAMTADDSFVITAIVLARLASPPLIPRIPLVTLAARVLDGSTARCWRTSAASIWGGPYQSFDKALDVY